MLQGKRGDMVWNTLIMITVLLPLAGLTVDIPRYMRLRSTLQAGVDAAAEAASRCLDYPVFYNSGDVRLDPDCAWASASNAFWGTVAALSASYSPAFDGISIDEAANTVTAYAHGTIHLFFNLSPAFTVHAESTSGFRVPVR